MEKLTGFKIVKNKELETLTEKLVDGLRNDKEVYPLIKSLGIDSTNYVRDNIGALADFQEDYHYCKNCPGYSKCGKKYPHLKLNLTNDGKHVEKSLFPCELAVEKLKRDSQYYVADFPEAWKETANVKTADKNESRKAVLSIYMDVTKKNAHKWIYMQGGARKGKSYLAACLTNDFVSHYGKAAFINASLRLKDMLDVFYNDKEDFADKMNALSNIPLLVIDDFGNEYKSDFVRDTILFPILNERFRNNLLTIFTSQFSYEDIQDMYSLSKASAVRAKQLKNMLKDACGDPILFEGISIY